MRGAVKEKVNVPPDIRKISGPAARPIVPPSAGAPAKTLFPEKETLLLKVNDPPALTKTAPPKPAPPPPPPDIGPAIPPAPPVPPP